MVNEKVGRGRLRGGLGAAVVALLLGNAVALGAIESPDATQGAAPGVEVTPELAGEVATPSSGEVMTTTSATQAPRGSTAPTTAPRSTTTTPTTERPPLPPGDYRYEVTVSPMCVQAGQPLTVTLRLRPGGSGVWIVVYADGQDHETMHAGVADAEGNVTATKPAAPVPGPATLTSQAGDGTGRTGVTTVDFQVGVTGKC